MAITIKDLIDATEKLLTEHASAAVMEKHLAFVKDQLKALQEEYVSLKKDLADAKENIRTLTGSLRSQAGSQDFADYHGVKFRRLPSGNYEDSVYCPDCMRTMVSLGNMAPYKCSKCGFIADFNAQSRNAIITKLRAEHL